MRYDKKADIEDVEVEEMKPRLYITAKDLPAIEKWDVGEKYTVLVELKQVSKSEREEDEVEACFEVVKIKELPKPKGSFSKDDVKVAMDMKKMNYLR